MANVPIYTEQGGTRMVVGEGATLVIEGDLEVAGGGDIVLGDDSVTTDMLQDDAVTTPKINNLAVTTAKIAGGAVTTPTLAAGAVTKAKTGMFISGDTVGDGMPQVIPHGLGVDPTTANLFFSVIDTAMAGDFAFTNIATDAMNITVTATANVVYRVQAWAP
jgi:hypothetical protein